MPSDNVYSIYIAPDNSQWLGTDAGVAKHVGHNALEGWSIIDKTKGLADDKVQAINANSKGIFYFGTANGLSVYDGENVTNQTAENGLVSNNILTIAIDKNDVVWIGTDNGVSCLKNGEFINYQ
jgi:ligand-binding sensor domain-containing protein